MYFNVIGDLQLKLSGSGKTHFLESTVNTDRTVTKHMIFT